MISLSRFLNEFKANKESAFSKIKPRVVCADGFSVSIQASAAHYCTPRENDLDFYTTLELGYPSSKEESLIPYMEGDLETTDPCDTIYAYVPFFEVEKLLDKHGGIVGYSQ